MLSPARSRGRPLGRTIVHVSVVITIVFGVLAGRGRLLERDPLRGARPFAVRPGGHRGGADRATRPILDRDGTTLARNETDANGELYRVYRGPAISQVVGYASARYGRAGLELAYDAELSGLAGDPAGRCAAQVRDRSVRSEGPQLALSW